MRSPSAEALRFPCESSGCLGRIGRIIDRAADYRIDVATGRGGERIGDGAAESADAGNK